MITALGTAVDLSALLCSIHTGHGPALWRQGGAGEGVFMQSVVETGWCRWGAVYAKRCGDRVVQVKN